MGDPYQDWSSLQSIFEQVLYRDPSGNIQQMEVRDGATRTMQEVTFADGSKLVIAAQVPLPPMDDLTSRKVSFLKLNGERGEKMDDGLGEAMDLARQSAAVQMFGQVAKILDGMPECEKVPCPVCHGAKCCQHCGGQGCPECQGKGACATCDGHGLVAK